MSKKMSWAFMGLLFMAVISFALLYNDTRNLNRQTFNNTVEIQKSRRDYLKWECEDVNNRNARTINTLFNYDFTRKTREFIIKFTNAALPVRNCARLVNEFAPLPDARQK